MHIGWTLTHARSSSTLARPQNAAVAAVRFAPPRLKAKVDAAEAYSAWLSAALQHFDENARRFAEGARDPAVLHQIRTALRRLRGLTAFFAPVTDDALAAAARAEIKALYDALAAARELDAIVLEGLWTRLSADSGRPPERLKSARRRAYRKARVRIAEQHIGDRIQRLLQAQGRVQPAPTLRTLGRTALSDARRKALRLARRYDRLSEADRHAFRRRLKTFRLAFETFVSHCAGEAKARDRLARRIGRTLDRLGCLNDLESVWVSGPSAPEAIREAAATLKIKAEAQVMKAVRRLLRTLEATAI